MDEITFKAPKEFLSNEQSELLKQVVELYPQVPTGMTEYQIEQFVLDLSEHPTWYSVYYQSLLESWSRFQIIVDMINNMKKTQIKNELYEARKVELLEEKYKDGVVAAKIKLHQHNINVNDHKIALQMRDLENKFKEIKIFMKIQEVAMKKMKGNMPKYGDNKSEKIKWYLKFLFKKHPLRSSLLSGSMEENKAQAIEYLTGAEKLKEYLDYQKSILPMQQGIK